MNVPITLRDVAEAVTKRSGPGAWERIRVDAQAEAYDRRLRENWAATDAALAELNALTGANRIAEWHAVQKRLTRLFAENDALQRAAFPDAFALDPKKPAR